MPAMGLGGTADVQVGELVEERLEDVAGADAWVGGDREAVLSWNGETFERDARDRVVGAWATGRGRARTAARRTGLGASAPQAWQRGHQ